MTDEAPPQWAFDLLLAGGPSLREIHAAIESIDLRIAQSLALPFDLIKERSTTYSLKDVALPPFPRLPVARLPAPKRPRFVKLRTALFAATLNVDTVNRQR